MSKMDKIDLFKENKAEYVQPKKPALIETKPAVYLAVDGQGAPGGKEFEDRIGALYSMAFTIKMTRKFEGKGDYAVCKLEMLYWLKNDKKDFANTPKEEWCWKMMIRTPDFIARADLDRAVAALEGRGKKTPAVDDVRLMTLDEGRCVQMLHVGPYDEEERTIREMLAFIKEQGLEHAGRHHEIYISDPRRVPPERLKTIVRLPVK